MSECQTSDKSKAWNSLCPNFDGTRSFFPEAPTALTVTKFNGTKIY